jgi:mono/diheme cytochrome c family protein
MRQYLIAAAALALIVENDALAQNIDNGRRISERSCAACHATNLPARRQARAISFTVIAEKPAMTADVIATFLLLPHVTMPGLPLGRGEAQDVAAFIMSLKK